MGITSIEIVLVIFLESFETIEIRNDKNKNKIKILKILNLKQFPIILLKYFFIIFHKKTSETK